MFNYREILEQLNEDRKSKGGKRYLEMRLPYSKIKRISKRSDYGDFIRNYGLGNASVVRSKSGLSVYVDPDADPETYSQLKRLSSRLGVPIEEFYGVVQLDGDEPDASNNYDRVDNNGLTTMEMKREMRKKENGNGESKTTIPKIVRKEKDSSTKTKNGSKTKKSAGDTKEERGITEVTGVANIPSKISAVDVMTTPIQRSRKKLNRQ